MSETASTTATAPEPVNAGQAIWQLRSALCGLGAAVLVLSLCFNLFIWKQNRNITAIANGRKRQLEQADLHLRELMRFANELAIYSNGKPELTAIFTRHGMELKQVPKDTAEPSLPPAATP